MFLFKEQFEVLDNMRQDIQETLIGEGREEVTKRKHED